MNEKSLMPAIRFAGFTDAWERRKLGEFVESLPFKKYIAAPTPDGKIEIIQQGNVPIIGYANGIPCDDYENITVFGDHTVSIYKPHNPFFLATDGTKLLSARSLDGDFFYFLLERYKPIPEGYKRHYTILIERYGCFPCKREQKQIAILLKHIDTLITHHQCKHEKLVSIKKSMLEKMFPKNGELFPEVRFAGFTDAWERRKLGELIEDYVERTTIQNQYPVLTSSQHHGIVLQEAYFADRQVTTNDNIGYFVLPKGYFTYRSRSDTDVFVFNRNDILDKGIISYYYPVFRAKNTDSDFLLRRLNHGTRPQLSMAAEGTGQKVLAHTKFKDITVAHPTEEEQRKIGAIFKALDTLITLHQRKLEKLQNIKKACLEKMFV